MWAAKGEAKAKQKQKQKQSQSTCRHGFDLSTLRGSKKHADIKLNSSNLPLSDSTRLGLPGFKSFALSQSLLIWAQSSLRCSGPSAQGFLVEPQVYFSKNFSKVCGGRPGPLRLLLRPLRCCAASASSTSSSSFCGFSTSPFKHVQPARGDAIKMGSEGKPEKVLEPKWLRT